MDTFEDIAEIYGANLHVEGSKYIFSVNGFLIATLLDNGVTIRPTGYCSPLFLITCVLNRVLESRIIMEYYKKMDLKIYNDIKSTPITDYAVDRARSLMAQKRPWEEVVVKEYELDEIGLKKIRAAIIT